jgi:hypothetical protein
MNLRRSISCFSKLAAAGAIGEHVALGAGGRHAQAKAPYLDIPEDRARRQPRLRPPSAWSVSPCHCSPFPSTKSAPTRAKVAACEGIINESEGKVLRAAAVQAGYGSAGPMNTRDAAAPASRGF